MFAGKPTHVTMMNINFFVESTYSKFAVNRIHMLLSRFAVATKTTTMNLKTITVAVFDALV